MITLFMYCVPSGYAIY